MADGEAAETECGFCLRRDGNLEDPRSLPCTHVHCLQCLIGGLEVIGIVRCPFCREVFDVDLNTLPSSNTREDASTCCDTCSRKGVTDQPAVIYCTTCSSKFCTKHREAHDDLLGAHPMITMTDYRAQARELEPRLCGVHAELAYSMGCRHCLTLVCVQCTDDIDVCKNGSAHKLLSLDELIAELSKEVDKLRSEIYEREDKLSALFKQTSRIICDYDTETKDMIHSLRETRDEQIQDIQLKYKKLEEELLELRGNVKYELSRFMEQDVGVKLCDLSKHRLQIEARIKHNDQVDVINKHGQTMDEIKKLISSKLPTLEIQNMATLEVKDQQREVEVGVIISYNGFVDLEHGLTTTNSLPKQLILLHTVDVSHYCPSVCSYEGNTYVGLENGKVDKIDENHQLSGPVLTLDDSVEGITVYKDRIYSLVRGDPYMVNVHDLAGQLITSWTHTDTDIGCYSGLVVTSDQVIVPDRENKKLTVYSLTGEVVKYIPCPLLGGKWVSMCAADDLSIIVSDYKTSKVFKVNITNGEVIWTSQHVAQPGGVAYHGGRVFVSAGDCINTTRLWILDVKTGKLLTEISDAVGRGNSHVFDLHLSGDTLIVPRFNERKVLFYQLD